MVMNWEPMRVLMTVVKAVDARNAIGSDFCLAPGFLVMAVREPRQLEEVRRSPHLESLIQFVPGRLWLQEVIGAVYFPEFLCNTTNTRARRASRLL